MNRQTPQMSLITVNHILHCMDLEIQRSSDHPILKYFYSILVLIHISSFLSIL